MAETSAAAVTEAPASTQEAPAETPKAEGAGPGGKATETKPAAPEPRRFKLKTLEDGKEVEAEYDEPTLARYLQKAKVADKRFSEAAKLASDAKRVIEEARSPETRAKALVELLGGEKEALEFAEGLVLERIKSQDMTEEQRQAAADRKELERLRALEAKRSEAEKEAAEAKSAAAVQARLEKTVLELADAAGLPRSPWALSLVLDVLAPVVEHDIPLTQEQLVAEVKESMQARAKERDLALAANLKGKALLDYLGEAVVREVLQASVQTYRPKLGAKVEPKAPPKGAELAAMTPKEFRQKVLGLDE